MKISTLAKCSLPVILTVAAGVGAALVTSKVALIALAAFALVAALFSLYVIYKNCRARQKSPILEQRGMSALKMDLNTSIEIKRQDNEAPCPMQTFPVDPFFSAMNLVNPEDFTNMQLVCKEMYRRARSEKGQQVERNMKLRQEKNNIQFDVEFILVAIYKLTTEFFIKRTKGTDEGKPLFSFMGGSVWFNDKGRVAAVSAHGGFAYRLPQDEQKYKHSSKSEIQKDLGNSDIYVSINLDYKKDKVLKEEEMSECNGKKGKICVVKKELIKQKDKIPELLRKHGCDLKKYNKDGKIRVAFLF